MLSRTTLLVVYATLLATYTTITATYITITATYTTITATYTTRLVHDTVVCCEYISTQRTNGTNIYKHIEKTSHNYQHFTLRWTSVQQEILVYCFL